MLARYDSIGFGCVYFSANSILIRLKQFILHTRFQLDSLVSESRQISFTAQKSSTTLPQTKTFLRIWMGEYAHHTGHTIAFSRQNTKDWMEITSMEWILVKMSEGIKIFRHAWRGDLSKLVLMRCNVVFFVHIHRGGLPILLICLLLFATICYYC